MPVSSLQIVYGSFKYISGYLPHASIEVKDLIQLHCAMASTAVSTELLSASLLSIHKNHYIIDPDSIMFQDSNCVEFAIGLSDKVIDQQRDLALFAHTIDPSSNTMYFATKAR